MEMRASPKDQCDLVFHESPSVKFVCRLVEEADKSLLISSFEISSGRFLKSLEKALRKGVAISVVTEERRIQVVSATVVVRSSPLV
jgi:hypothetical protein